MPGPTQHGMYQGLSREEAQARLKTHGYNELRAPGRKHLLHIAREAVREPMFILLLGCGAIYLILGDTAEGILLLGWVVFIVLLTFYQNQKTERALEALRRLSAPRALVLRDGLQVRIPGREVVPGDVVILNEGDRVPADGMLLESRGLSIDEALLTGESMPVPKGGEGEGRPSSRAFSGTLVVQGYGMLQVTHTGSQTEFGQIGESLETISPAPTRLQHEMKTLTRNLLLAGIFLSAVVLLAFYLTRGDLLRSLLNSLATAMAMLPEEFPVVLTVFLALGSWRLSRQHVLTRKPAAIETLGSATVLCSDKTGTITRNTMELATLVTGQGVFSREDFPEQQEAISEMLRLAHWASREQTTDPMEKAIEQAYHRGSGQEASRPALVREYPLTANSLMMTRVVRLAETGHLVCCKGAPERVLTQCNIGGAEKERILAQASRLAAQGQRVLGVARAAWPGPDLPESPDGFNFTWIGLLGFEDPIRPEVPQAMRQCKSAGIKVIMITGDYPATASAIAKQAGLSAGKAVLTGADLNRMGDRELAEQIRAITVFARIVPEQKLRIVRALQANGEVVAMTGDGVNDAPALKAADIGIAMGAKGTDVAREASSLVLLDDNFSSIVSAVRSGRRIFDNLQKAMSYITAIHIPIIGLTLLPAFFPELPILLMPLHIVFMELIIDPVCSLAFESEQEEDGVMERPPRDPKALFFGLRKFLQSILSGILLLALVMGVYLLSINEGHSEGEIRAIAFSSLIVGNVFLILTTLSRSRSAWAVLLEKNRALLVILLAAGGLLLTILAIPALRDLFAFEYPGASHFVSAGIGASLLLLILETAKFFKRRIRPGARATHGGTNPARNL